jgi:molybdate transport system substrate-binding protein
VKRLVVPLGILLFLLVAALGRPACRFSEPPEPGPRGRVRVAAAADLNAALPAIVSRFGASHDVDVSIAYGSSGTFYAQLLNQAPFDLFLSADVGYPNQLAARGLTLPQSEFTYAVGRLVVWAPAASPLDVERQGLQALTAPALAHVAIANPEHAPYGRAAVAALQAAGVYDAVRPKIVFGESVAQAMQFAQSGAAGAAVVARSLAVAPNVKGTGAMFDIPPALYPRMDQGGVILRWTADADAARALRGFLLSAEGRAILERSGFALPER